MTINKRQSRGKKLIFINRFRIKRNSNMLLGTPPKSTSFICLDYVMMINLLYNVQKIQLIHFQTLAVGHLYFELHW